MPYAEGRIYYDSDSHIMETADWLTKYATPEQEGLLKPLSTEKGGKGVMKAIEAANKRRADPEATERLLEQPLISGPKGWAAFGASCRDERSKALDLLGFHKQLVFPTFAMGQFIGSRNVDKVYAGADMLNRSMAEFCGSDDRLLAVGSIPLKDPERALQTAQEAIEMGISAAWITSDPIEGKSPSHLDFFPLWELLEKNNIPVVLHIGGGRGLDPDYHNNGRPKTLDWLGGGENLRGKDFHAVAHTAENFLTAMIYDHVLMKFPNLMFGVIELGATWVPGFLRNLDHGHNSFKKMEPLLNELEMKPSEYFQRQVRVSLFPFEDAGWLIDQCGEDIFMFASDYPHPEGGRDPIGRFDGTLDEWNVSDSARDKFYQHNFARLLHIK